MPCDTRQNLTQAERDAQADALARLERSLALQNATTGVSVVIGANGAVAFRGWAEAERGGLSDVCAYRKLLASNSPALRKAVARAEAMSGRKIDARQVAAGTHSHDGGNTFHHGH